MNTAANNSHDIPEYAYHLLRGALQHFQKSIPELSDSQYQEARAVADKTFSLESRVLSTAEARDIIIPDAKLDAAIQEVAARYENQQAFVQDLKNNHLNEDILRNALYRELLFNAVMERAAANMPDISELDIKLFYQLHKDRFSKPEQRKAKHILITINPEFAENEQSAAYERIAAIQAKLQKSPSRFEALARKCSECPTAMEGGKLGEVVRGTLFPELDAELFKMKEGEVSGIIETEMGFHILVCEKIIKSVTLPLSRAKEQIEYLLKQRQKKTCQKKWLAKLLEQ